MGTLIEPNPPVAEAYRRVALQQKVDLDLEVIRKRFSKAFANLETEDGKGPLETSEKGEWNRWRRIVAAVLPELPSLDLGFALLWDHFGDSHSWQTFPDLEACLQALIDHGIPFCMASNFDSRLRGIADELEALTKFGDNVVVSSEVGYRKPHAEVYRAAAELLELPASQLLYVGDDLENDVAGPLRAGYFGGLLLDRRGKSSPPEGVEKVTSLDELTSWFRSGFQGG